MSTNPFVDSLGWVDFRVQHFVFSVHFILLIQNIWFAFDLSSVQWVNDCMAQKKVEQPPSVRINFTRNFLRLSPVSVGTLFSAYFLLSSISDILFLPCLLELCFLLSSISEPYFSVLIHVTSIYLSYIAFSVCTYQETTDSASYGLLLQPVLIIASKKWYLSDIGSCFTSYGAFWKSKHLIDLCLACTLLPVFYRVKKFFVHLEIAGNH